MAPMYAPFERQEKGPAGCMTQEKLMVTQAPFGLIQYTGGWGGGNVAKPRPL